MPARVREMVARMYRAAREHKVTTVVFGASLAAIVALGAVAASSASDRPAPGFSLAALGGSSSHVSLAAYAGRPVIINFFASWCVPCRKETPLLAGYFRATHGSVAIVGIDSNDSQTAAVTFTRAAGVSYPLAYDPVATTASAFGVVEIPQTFFLNAQHHIVDRVFGAVTATELAKGVALMGKPTARA